MTVTKENCEKFHVFLREQEHSDQTVQKYIRDIRKLSEFAAGRALTKALLVEFKAYLMERFKPTSVNSILAAANKFLDFWGLHGCKVKPLKLQKIIFNSEEKELKRSEYLRLLEAARSCGNERLMLIIETISSTGIRISELKFITAKAIRAGRAEVNCKGKFRVIFLPEKLCGVLKKYTEKQKITAGAVFITRSGKPIDRSNVWRELKKLAEMAQVKKQKVFPHNFRHFFARTFYSKEKDIVRLADILGHSSVSTTRIYTTESGNAHIRQLERLDLVITS